MQQNFFLLYQFMDIIPHIKRGLSEKIVWKFHGQSQSGVNCGVRLQSKRAFYSFHALSWSVLGGEVRRGVVMLK
jgi:hypothetical protein